MLTPRSKLPRRVTQAYWLQVRRLLLLSHRLDVATARRAILAYRSALARGGVRDEIYHAQVEVTAEGIVQGGYAIKGRKHQTTP